MTCLTLLPEPFFHRRLEGSVDGDELAALAPHPHLEDVCISKDSYFSADDLLPLVEAMAQQPTTLPTLVVLAELEDPDEVTDVMSGHAGGRKLMIEANEEEEDYGSYM
jgi:hypothetical protein